jgi:GPI mannosyltransferase 3
MNAHRVSPSKLRASPLKIKRRQSPTGDTATTSPVDRRLLLSLIALRIVNALTIRTFFQPDEYYQSLEPAWRFVYGYGELTWEWREGIRGFLYPSVFASVWWIADVLGIKDANILVRIIWPFEDLLMGRFRCHIWCRQCLLACVIFGHIVLQDGYSIITSPSGRYNCCLILWMLTEALLFCHFSVELVYSHTDIFKFSRDDSHGRRPPPLAMAIPVPSPNNPLQQVYHPETPKVLAYSQCSNISISLILASIAVLLRPTSIITFILLLPFSLSPNLILHAIIIGPTALLCTIVLDTLYFHRPTFPAWNFLRFNFLEELSVFYGSMAPHYYLSQGLPMILTTYLPFSLHGLSFFPFSVYTVVIVGVIAAFSCIAHKEARFISPLSPLLLLFVGYSLARVPRRIKRILLPMMVMVNVGVTYYATRVHQSGVIGVIHHLRKDIPVNGSVGFLMPCYSTPWQTFLQRPDVVAWKLSCDPPLTYPPRQPLFPSDSPF